MSARVDAPQRRAAKTRAPRRVRTLAAIGKVSRGQRAPNGRRNAIVSTVESAIERRNVAAAFAAELPAARTAARRRGGTATANHPHSPEAFELCRRSSEWTEPPLVGEP